MFATRPTFTTEINQISFATLTGRNPIKRYYNFHFQENPFFSLSRRATRYLKHEHRLPIWLTQNSIRHNFHSQEDHLFLCQRTFRVTELLSRDASFHHCLGTGAAIRWSEFRGRKMAEQCVSSIELTLSRKFTLRPNKRVSTVSTEVRPLSGTNVYFISAAMKRIPVLSLSFFSPLSLPPSLPPSLLCLCLLSARRSRNDGRTLWVCCAKWDRPRIYSTANYHSADGLFALRIHRLRATIAAISVSDDARCLQISVIDYEPPGRLERGESFKLAECYQRW